MELVTWYVYQAGGRVGPFTEEQMRQLIAAKALRPDAYVYRTGFADWVPLSECVELSGAGTSPAERRRHPRVDLTGRLIAHDDGDLLVGRIGNLSCSGVFLETQTRRFSVGDVLKVSVRAQGVIAPFNALAEVVRTDFSSEHATGYGLRFVDMPPALAARLNDAISSWVES